MRLIHHRQRHDPHDEYAYGGPEFVGPETGPEAVEWVPTQQELEEEAHAEYPDDPEAAQEMYAQNMVLHGYAVQDPDAD